MLPAWYYGRENLDYYSYYYGSLEDDEEWYVKDNKDTIKMLFGQSSGRPVECFSFEAMYAALLDCQIWRTSTSEFIRRKDAVLAININESFTSEKQYFKSEYLCRISDHDNFRGSDDLDGIV